MRAYISLILLICIVLTQFCSTGNDKTQDTQNDASNEVNNTNLNNALNDNNNFENNENNNDNISSVTTQEDVLSLITGATYHVDPVVGDDENAGTEEAPFKSIGKVLSVVQSGDGVILGDGNHGDFIDLDNKRGDGWVVFIAEEGANPFFTKIEISYEEPDNAYLIFYGIDVTVEWVDPDGGNTGADDPYYADSDQNTYEKTEDAIRLNSVNNFRFYKGKITGTNENLTKLGIWMETVENIIIEKNEISAIQIPIQLWYASNVYIRNNHIHGFVSSCIRYGDFNRNIYIEQNHCHDMNWDVSEPYTPRLPGTNYHNSVIALYTGDVTIRNNIFHDGFTSSGIMFYDNMGNVFHNVIIENNLMYDIQTAVLRLNNAGENIIIRNNTIVGYFREHSMGRYNYYTTLNVHSLGEEFDGSDIKIYNNIFAGGVFFYEGYDTIQQGNNIFWSLQNLEAGEWITNATVKNNSKVITWDATFPDYFAAGFFSEDPDFAFAHHKTLDFTLSTTAEAINFGDPTEQPSDSLGTLDENGFVQSNGRVRDESYHSAGCFEIFE